MRRHELTTFVPLVSEVKKKIRRETCYIRVRQVQFFVHVLKYEPFRFRASLANKPTETVKIRTGCRTIREPISRYYIRAFYGCRVGGGGGQGKPFRRTIMSNFAY